MRACVLYRRSGVLALPILSLMAFAQPAMAGTVTYTVAFTYSSYGVMGHGTLTADANAFGPDYVHSIYSYYFVFDVYEEMLNATFTGAGYPAFYAWEVGPIHPALAFDLSASGTQREQIFLTATNPNFTMTLDPSGGTFGVWQWDADGHMVEGWGNSYQVRWDGVGPVVPEPGCLTLLLTGVVALGIGAHRGLTERTRSCSGI